MIISGDANKGTGLGTPRRYENKRQIKVAFVDDLQRNPVLQQGHVPPKLIVSITQRVLYKNNIYYTSRR
jgi:hypothetical protein